MKPPNVMRLPRAEEWADRICTQVGKSIEAILETGRLLMAAKDELGHGEWGRLFEEHLVPFGIKTAFRLMTIADHPLLSNGAHGHHLPPSWRTLYELTKIPEATLKQALEDGTITPDMPRSVVADLITEEQRLELQATRDRDLADWRTRLGADESLAVYHEDFRQCADRLKAGSVGLIFTDPPYRDVDLEVYTGLGAVAARVLKDGGSLITYAGQHRIPEVIEMLRGAGLTFFWPIAMVHTGSSARMNYFGIVVKWKPLLWFVNGTNRPPDEITNFVDDLVMSTPPTKIDHPWQQSTTEASYYIGKLTQPGDLVFDPFCGSGTTAIACALATRRWLTCDSDEASVWIARQRIREATEIAGS